MKKKVVIITGGCKGVGLSIAQKFIKNNHEVYITCRDPAKHLKKVKFFDSGHVIKLDLKLQESVNEFKKKIENLNCEVFINNAGDYSFRKANKDIDETSISNTLKINFINPLMLSIFMCDLFQKRKIEGSIWNISSITTKYIGNIKSIDYTLSKNGIELMTKLLAQDYAKFGIRINCLRLGIVDTEIHMKNKDKNMKTRINKSPIKRLIQKTEVSDLLFLLENYEHDSMTGSIQELTGGE